MNRSFRSILMAGACASSLIMLGAWQSRDVAAASPSVVSADTADAPAEPGQLRMRVSAAKGAAHSDDVAGDMRTPSGALSFHTTSLFAGKSAAIGVAPERVRVRLEVNGAVIDHEIDYAAGTMTVRTVERVVIDAGDRAVLRSFQNELGRALNDQGDMQRMPKSKDFLWRLAEMYSEVPLGRTFAPVWVVRRGDASKLERPAPTLSEPRLPFARDTGKGLPIATRVICNDQGGGSFINLRSIANVCDNDVAFTRSSSHDYCPTHGYAAKSVRYGCSSTSCAGRCGAGCGVGDGVGAWYQDCLDHDVCNRDHNSQLGACGDEFNEAADDYAFGAISCYTTCG